MPPAAKPTATATQRKRQVELQAYENCYTTVTVCCYKPLELLPLGYGKNADKGVSYETRAAFLCALLPLLET